MKCWNSLRRDLEEDFICDSLRGRVQYFITHYDGGAKQLGRIAILVDGVEILHGNSYDFYAKGYAEMELNLKDELEIPDRQWTIDRCLYDEENTAIENMVREIARNNGVFEIYELTDAILEYINLTIKESLYSNNGIVRMLAVMDKRTGKSALLKLKNYIEEQPSWLKFFYKLRLDAEEIIY